MVNLLAEELNQLLSLPSVTTKEKNKFLKRIARGKLTRDENVESHFCVYFAAFDPQEKQVFIGHHRKSGLWLFNGGHIDQGETLNDVLKREISEEWDVPIDLKVLKLPSLLTVTRIKKNPNQKCKWHYDIWCFVEIGKNKFHPVREKLEKEFLEWKWLSPELAMKWVTDSNTVRVLRMMKKKFVEA